MICQPRCRRLTTLLGLVLLVVSCAPVGGPRTGPATSAPTATAPPASAAAWPAAVQRLIDGARAEGELNLVLSASFFKRSEALPQIQDAFNQRYGISVRIQRTVGPTMPQLAALVGQEVQAGKKPQTDLFLGSDIHIGTLVRTGALEPIDWRALDDRIPPMAVAEATSGWHTARPTQA